MPINKGYLTKITAERARRERPDFIAPGTTNEVQKALVGKPLEKVVRSAPVIQGEVQAPQSTKVIKLDGGRISIVHAIQLFGWTPKNRFAWQLDRSSITLIAQEDGDLAFDASNAKFTQHFFNKCAFTLCVSFTIIRKKMFKTTFKSIVFFQQWRIHNQGSLEIHMIEIGLRAFL